MGQAASKISIETHDLKNRIARFCAYLAGNTAKEAEYGASFCIRLFLWRRIKGVQLLPHPPPADYAPAIQNVSVEAKLLYGLLLDRMGLSEEHGWYDEDGRVFTIIRSKKLPTISAATRQGDEAAAELDKAKGAGLIERIRQGKGKPTKIYVKRFTTREVPPKKEEIPAPISEVEILDVQKSGNPDF